jgi:hypothetical protein
MAGAGAASGTGTASGVGSSTAASTGEAAGTGTATGDGVILVYLRPDADHTDGSWTNELGGTELYSSIDEITPNDSDYVQSSDNPSADTFRVRMSNPSGGVTRPFKVRYRIGKSSSSRIDIVARVFQGTTQVVSWTHEDIAESLTTITQTLSQAEFEAISDPYDLYFEIRADAV